MNVIHSEREIDLDNFHQRSRAAGLFFRVVDAGLKGSTEYGWMIAEKPYEWHPTLDGRSAEAKALKKAEEAVMAALGAYDKARLAAKAAAKGKR